MMGGSTYVQIRVLGQVLNVLCQHRLFEADSHLYRRHLQTQIILLQQVPECLNTGSDRSDLLLLVKRILVKRSLGTSTEITHPVRRRPTT